MGKQEFKSRDYVDIVDLQERVNDSEHDIAAMELSKEDSSNITAGRKLSALGNFTGTWEGHPYTDSDPAVQETVINHTAQLADIAINVSTFGAKGDSVYDGDKENLTSGTDDTIAIQSALDYAGSSIYKTVLLENKIYKITQKLIIPSGVKLVGKFYGIAGTNRNGSVIFKDSDGDAVEMNDNSEVDGFTIQYSLSDNSINTGVGLIMARGSRIKNISVQRARTCGFKGYSFISSFLENCCAFACNIGFDLRNQLFGSTLIKPNILSCVTGILVDGANGTTLYDTECQGHGIGIKILSCSALNIIGGYFEDGVDYDIELGISGDAVKRPTNINIQNVYFFRGTACKAAIHNYYSNNTNVNNCNSTSHVEGFIKFDISGGLSTNWKVIGNDVESETAYVYGTSEAVNTPAYSILEESTKIRYTDYASGAQKIHKFDKAQIGNEVLGAYKLNGNICGYRFWRDNSDYFRYKKDAEPASVSDGKLFFYKKITVTVDTTETTIPHGLGYTPTDIFFFPKSNAVVWKSTAEGPTNIYLTASASVSVDVYVK